MLWLAAVVAHANLPCLDKCPEPLSPCAVSLTSLEHTGACNISCSELLHIQNCYDQAALECRGWWTQLLDGVSSPPDCDGEWSHCADENESCAITHLAEVRHSVNTAVSTTWIADGPFFCDRNVFGMPTNGSCEFRTLSPVCSRAFGSLFPQGGLFPAECCSVFESAAPLLHCSHLPCAHCSDSCTTVSQGFCRARSTQGICYQALAQSLLADKKDFCVNASITLIAAVPDNGSVILPQGDLMLVFDEVVQQADGNVGFLANGELTVVQPALRGSSVFVPIPNAVFGDVQVLLHPGAFLGLSGRYFLGISDDFVLRIQNSSAPQVVGLWPPTKATEVSISTPVTITFDRPVQIRSSGGGFFEVYEYHALKLVRVIHLSSRSSFRLGQARPNEIVVALPTLQYGHLYRLVVVPNAFESLDGTGLETIGQYELAVALKPEWTPESADQFAADGPGSGLWIAVGVGAGACGVCVLCFVFLLTRVKPSLCSEDLEAGECEAEAGEREAGAGECEGEAGEYKAHCDETAGFNDKRNVCGSSDPARTSRWRTSATPYGGGPHKAQHQSAQQPAITSCKKSKTPGHAALNTVDPLAEIEQELKVLKRQPLHSRKARIKALLLQWHPDKNRCNKEQATRVFQVINEKRPWLLEGD